MENVIIEMTLQREGRSDIRVQLTLSVEDNEIKKIDFKKLMTKAEMNWCYAMSLLQRPD